MAYYIGIDIGTSSAKLTMIDDLARIVKEASREYELLQPQSGFKEICPETWMEAAAEAMEELLLDMEPGQVKAIGCTGQMHTLCLIGQDGQSVRPALMWNDTRTADMLPSVKAAIRELKEVPYIARIISTGSPAMNLLWLKENEPENFKKIKTFLIGPDYIVYRLCGSLATDYCEASTSSLLDIHKKEWSGEIRQLFGFPETIYPEITGSQKIRGVVSEEWCRRFGFGPDVKVITGTGDNPAAAISTGCFSEKYPVISLGTSGVVMFPREELDLSAKGKNILFSFDGQHHQILVQGSVQSCGSSMNWWFKDILNTGDFSGETDVDIKSLGKNNLYFFPYLLGDKTVYANPGLRGAFVGISTDTSRKDMSIAVMEGIAYALRQLTEVMKIPKDSLQKLKVTGGGSKNRVWMQILADVLNVSVTSLGSGAGAGYGMAITAVAACKNATLQEMLADTINMKNTFHPMAENVERYEIKYQKFLKFYDALKNLI